MTWPEGHASRPPPVDLSFEVEVRAAPAEVWTVLARIGAWPRWHRGVELAILRGELAEGTRLDWRAEGMRIRSVIREVEPGRRLGLSLRMLGGTGYARWSLDEAGAGRTLVRLEEAWDGLFVRLLRRTLVRTLRASRTAWLHSLRVRVEGHETRADP